MLHKAVLLVTFNRLDYLKEVFEAIAKAQPPRLYLASDGPRESKSGEKEKVQEVRAWLLSHVNWPCEVKTRFLEKNSGGCGLGVSGAVTWFFQNEKDGIVLEDDCLPTQSFFRYCEELLDRYADNKRIWHISGMAPIDVKTSASYYFAKIMQGGGWAGWADRWLPYFTLDISSVDEEVFHKFSPKRYIQNYWRGIVELCNHGNMADAWDYQWTVIIVAHDGLCINAVHNQVSNIGTIGTHFSENSLFVTPFQPSYELTAIVHPQKIECDYDAVNRIYRERYLIKTRMELLSRLLIRTVLPKFLVNILRRYNIQRINRKRMSLGVRLKP